MNSLQAAGLIIAAAVTTIDCTVPVHLHNTPGTTVGTFGLVFKGLSFDIKTGRWGQEPTSKQEKKSSNLASQMVGAITSLLQEKENQNSLH